MAEAAAVAAASSKSFFSLLAAVAEDRGCWYCHDRGCCLRGKLKRFDRSKSPSNFEVKEVIVPLSLFVFLFFRWRLAGLFLLPLSALALLRCVRHAMVKAEEEEQEKNGKRRRQRIA